MSDHNYTYRKPDLNLYQVNSGYTLLLQIQATSFSYAIAYQNKLMAWAENCDLQVLDDPGDDHELLTFDYKNIVAALPSTGFTLIPNVLYSEEHVANLAKFLDVKPGEKVFAQPLDDENHIIYKAGEAVVATADIFGLQKTVFAAKGWINAIGNSHPSADNIYLNIDKNKVDVLYFAAGKLRFFNTFEFHNPDELVYFTALVLKEIGLAPKNINAVLSGDVLITDKNASRLADFFNGVELNSIKPLELPDEILPQQLLALAALSLCVSSEVY